MNENSSASFFYTLKSVLWALLGVRGGKGYEDDVRRITAKQAITVGFIAVILFILILYFIVSFVISSATGQ